MTQVQRGRAHRGRSSLPPASGQSERPPQDPHIIAGLGRYADMALYPEALDPCDHQAKAEPPPLFPFEQAYRPQTDLNDGTADTFAPT